MKKFAVLSMAIFSLSFGSEVEEKIKVLQQQIESLKKELEELKTAKEETKVLKEEFRKLKLELIIPEATERYAGLGPAASKVYQLEKGVSIGGYGELIYENYPNKEPKSELDLYRFILYFGYSFTKKLKFNSEIELEHAFVKGDKHGYLAIEFAYLDYNFSPAFGIRGGMLLVPVGIVNELHEPPTYVTVQKPYLERYIIPTAWYENGIGIYGETQTLSYRVYLMNGMKAEKGKFNPSAPLKELRQRGSEALADSLAITGRIDFKFAGNLNIGASTFISGVQDERGNNLGTIYLFSPHFWWQHAGFDIRFVGVYMNTKDAEKITKELSTEEKENVFPKRTQGFYFQVAYNILRHFDTEHELYVFGMYENYDTHASVPTGYSKPKGSEVNIYNFGISYKPHPLVSLKVDYVREDYKDKKDYDVYRAAIAWMF
ncbi:MAG TPA: DUF3373 domain-containing protein [Aquificaceae bacterium]|nr:DUF3373 domain-containing protein [Aquificaceae bacterium]